MTIFIIDIGNNIKTEMANQKTIIISVHKEELIVIRSKLLDLKSRWKKKNKIKMEILTWEQQHTQ